MAPKKNVKKSKTATPIAVMPVETPSTVSSTTQGSSSSSSGLLILGVLAVVAVIGFLVKDKINFYPAKKELYIHLVNRFSGDKLSCGPFKSWGICATTQNRVALSDNPNYRILEFTEEGKLVRSFSPQVGPKDPRNGLSGIASDTKGNIHVLDNSSKILIHGFTPEGKPLPTVDASPTGYFYNPVGLGCVGDNFIISDTGSNRVVIMRPDGSSDKIYSGAGKGKNQWSNPMAGISDARNFLYIADSGNNRVKIMDPSGQVIQRINLRSAPVALALDGIGRLYVCFNNDQFIQVYSAIDGKYLGDLAVQNPDSDLAYRTVVGLCVTTDGKLIAAEKNAISVYDLPVQQSN